MNNPWTGGGASGSPSVIVSLNTISNVNGEDLDIKIEWDTTGGITSARFYRGWRLDEVFDYTRANNGTYTDGTTHTVYGTVSQSVPYVTDTVMISHGNHNWNWSFHTANSSDTFGYNNKGFILWGASDSVDRLYAGTDPSGGSYGGVGSGRTGFTKVRVYAKLRSDHSDSCCLVKINSTSSRQDYTFNHSYHDGFYGTWAKIFDVAHSGFVSGGSWTGPAGMSATYQTTDIIMSPGADLYSAKRVRFTPVTGKYIGIWFGPSRTSDKVTSVRSSLPSSTDTRFTVAPTSQALYVRNSPGTVASELSKPYSVQKRAFKLL